ncbi:MAG: hypothetical protein ACOC1F_04635 [Myxococcota bacterium]
MPNVEPNLTPDAAASERLRELRERAARSIQQREETLAALDAAQRALSETRRENAELSELVQHLQTQLAEQSSKAHDADDLRTTLRQADSCREQAKRRIATVEAENQGLLTNVRELSCQLDRLRTRNAELLRADKRAQGELDQLRASFKSFRASTTARDQKRERIIAEARDRETSLQQQLAQLTQELRERAAEQPSEHRLDELERALAGQQAIVKELQNACQTQQHRATELEAALSAERQRATELQTLHASAQEQRDALQTALEQERQRTAELEASHASAQEQRDGLQTALERERQRASELEASHASAQEQRDALQTALERERQRTAEFQSVCSAQQGRTLELEAALSSEREAVAALHDELQRATAQCTQLENMLTQSQASIEEFQAAADDLEWVLPDTEAEDEHLEIPESQSIATNQEIAHLRQHSVELENTISQQHDEIAALESGAKAYALQVHELEASLACSQSRISTLEERAADEELRLRATRVFHQVGEVFGAALKRAVGGLAWVSLTDAWEQRLSLLPAPEDLPSDDVAALDRRFRHWFVETGYCRAIVVGLEDDAVVVEIANADTGDDSATIVAHAAVLTPLLLRSRFLALRDIDDGEQGRRLVFRPQPRHARQRGESDQVK